MERERVTNAAFVRLLGSLQQLLGLLGPLGLRSPLRLHLLQPLLRLLLSRSRSHLLLLRLLLLLPGG